VTLNTLNGVLTVGMPFTFADNSLFACYNANTAVLMVARGVSGTSNLTIFIPATFGFPANGDGQDIMFSGVATKS
jgi:hypothetical protein